VPVLFDNLPSSKAHIDAGKFRLLAVAAPKRLPAYPNVPTFTEIGMKDVNDPAWYGLVAPAKTPKEIIDKLYAASVKAVNSPATKEKLAQQGADPLANTPAEFAAQIKLEYDKMKVIVVNKGIKLD
jgi:tripartite-type tricarboxylate transporter receptor subunit TctC